MNQVYENNFIQAIERSKNLGIPTSENRGFAYPRIINFWMNLRIRRLILNLFKDHSSKIFEFQCINAHYYLKPFLDNLIGCETIFTLGYVKTNSGEHFYFTEEEFLDWIKNGLGNNSVNIHAWLTLPSGEIVDLSIIHSFARNSRKQYPKSAYLADYPYKLKNIEYVPMYTGIELLFRMEPCT